MSRYNNVIWELILRNGIYRMTDRIKGGAAFAARDEGPEESDECRVPSSEQWVSLSIRLSALSLFLLRRDEGAGVQRSPHGFSHFPFYKRLRQEFGDARLLCHFR